MSLQLSSPTNPPRKKREGGDCLLNGTPTAKRMRMVEPDARPEANPNTIDGVRDKNRAMAIDMQEKQRRIAFLTTKCERLWKQRVVADAQFRSLQRQWLGVVETLRSVQQAVDASGTEATASLFVEKCLEDMETLGALRMNPEDVQMDAPEWFLMTKEEGAETNNGDAEMEVDQVSGAALDGLLSEEERNYLKQRQEEAKELLRQVLATMEGKGPENKADFAQLLRDKEQAIEKMLLLKEEIFAMKQRLRDAQHDLEAKEVERHQACRDYDRLRHIMDTRSPGASSDEAKDKEETQVNGTGNEEKKQTHSEDNGTDQDSITKSIDREHKLREDMKILLDKLTQERSRVADMQRELERLQASESASQKQESLLRQEFDDQNQRLLTENDHLSEELAKIRHKASDMEQHLHDKWKKKLDKLQADVAKAKAQTDALTVKNAALREKLSCQSVFRDQLSDLKTDHAALQQQCSKLQQQLEREQDKSSRSRHSADNKEIVSLREQLSLLTEQKAHLQAQIDELKETNGFSSNEALRREQECRTKLEELQKERSSLKVAVGHAQQELGDVKAEQNAVQQENDVLVGEIEALSKEIEAARHSKKKVIHQLEEKRVSAKKFQSQLIKESDARAHCFEELAAARLQVSSLSQIHKQETATMNAAKETIQAHEAQLQELKAYVKQLEVERDVVASEKIKMQRETDTTKHLYETELAHQQQEQDRKMPCEQCEVFRKKQVEYEHQLAIAKCASSGSNGALTDLERFELQDLQKMLKCSVCQDRKKDVIISKCYHMFCKECIDNNLKSRNRKCPTCKKMFGQDDVKNVWFT